MFACLPGCPGNLGNPTARVKRVVDYLKETSPWFKAKQGRDHFICER